MFFYTGKYNIYMYNQSFTWILLLPPAQVKAILDFLIQNLKQAARRLHKYLQMI